MKGRGCVGGAGGCRDDITFVQLLHLRKVRSDPADCRACYFLEMRTIMKRALAASVATALFVVAGFRLGAQTPAFEVASIKPSPPGDPSNPLTMIPMMMPQPGGRFRASNMPVWVLISAAWQLP